MRSSACRKFYAAAFGQLVTSTLVHGGIPIKKVALMQLVGRNISGAEADRWGIISQAVPAAELESTVTGIAREISERHLAPLEHAKITVQMGRDLSLSQAIQLDQLVSARMRRVMDPTQHVEIVSEVAEGRPNLEYKRPDVCEILPLVAPVARFPAPDGYAAAFFLSPRSSDCINSSTDCTSPNWP